MSTLLLTALFAAASVALIAIDAKRRSGVSWAVWIPLIWVALIGSRPVTGWFQPVYVASAGVAEQYDSGDPVERWLYIVLIFIALLILSRRKVDRAELFRANAWLVVFAGYCALSVLWADLPFVAFKRWFKDVGNILMILVIMTEVNPVAAIKAVFYRVAAVLIPFSYLLIKYIPELGRVYHPSTGEVQLAGVTTQKNMLGALAMVCLIFLVWDFVERRKRRAGTVSTVLDVALIGLTVWALLISESATSLLCTVLAGIVFIGLRMPTVRNNIGRWWVVVVVTGMFVWVLDSTLGLSTYVIVDLLGRDLTLTTRTEVWPILLRYAHDPILGAGFSSFWSGARLAELYSQFGIIQAHNGYLELFLNSGVVGVLLLVALLLSVIRRLNAEVRLDSYDLAAVRLAILVAAITYNFAEAAYNKWSIVWVMTLFAIVSVPLTAVRRSSAAARVDRMNPMMRNGQAASRNASRVALRSRE